MRYMYNLIFVIAFFFLPTDVGLCEINVVIHMEDYKWKKKNLV